MLRDRQSRAYDARRAADAEAAIRKLDAAGIAAGAAVLAALDAMFTQAGVTRPADLHEHVDQFVSEFLWAARNDLEDEIIDHGGFEPSRPSYAAGQPTTPTNPLPRDQGVPS